MRPIIFGVILAALAAVEAGSGGKGGDSKAGPGGSGGNSKGGGGTGGNGGSVQGTGGASTGGTNKGDQKFFGGSGGNSRGGNGGSTGDGGSADSGSVYGTGQGGYGGSQVNRGPTIIVQDSYYGPQGGNGGYANTGGNTAGSSGQANGGASGASSQDGNKQQQTSNGGKGGQSITGGSSGGGGRGGSGGPAQGGSPTSGNGGQGGKGGDTSVSVPLSLPPLRVRDLFYNRPNPLYARNKEVRLFGRANTAQAPKDSKPNSPAPPAGGHVKVNEKGGKSVFALISYLQANSRDPEITKEEFVSMITKKQKFPDTLEKALAASSIGKEYTPPPKREDCPKDLADHPATHAIEMLNSKNIPPEIMAAINDPKNGWTKKAGSTPNSQKAEDKKSAPAGNAAAAKPPAQAPVQAPAQPPAQNPAPAKKKNQRSLYGHNNHYQINERNVYTSIYSDIYGRDAEPDAFSGIYRRSATYGEFDNQYTPNAYSYQSMSGKKSFPAVARPASYSSKPVGGNPMAFGDHMNHMDLNEFQALVLELELNPKAQMDTLNAINRDPRLLTYAHQLETGY